VHRKPEIEKRNERPEIVDRRTGRAPLTARVGLLESDGTPWLRAEHGGHVNDDRAAEAACLKVGESLP